MSLSADSPFVSRPAPNIAAGALALGVHALFVLLLVFGVSWQTQHPAPVMVDLWSALPQIAPPEPDKPVMPQPTPVPERPPEPKPAKVPEPVKAPEPVKVPEPVKAPEPVKVPEPVKAVPAPKPQPVVKEPPPVKAPDIALEKKKAEEESLKRMKALQAVEEKELEEAARAEAEAMKKVREKQLADQKKRELLSQMAEEDLMQRMMEEEAANEMRQVASARRQSELAHTIAQYRDMISAKVRGNTRLPDTLQGNPEVRCLVRLLPTGEVQSVRVTQSSGNAAYDEAVVRAIEKSSPLPLPSEREARDAFVPELSFIHHPKE
jgi:colicin import membrane protein